MHLNIISMAGLLLAAIASPASAPADFDPARQVVFRGGLECCLVKGVGCGHLALATLADAEAVAERVRAVLTSKPSNC